MAPNTVSEVAKSEETTDELLKKIVTKHAALNLSNHVTFDTPDLYVVNGGYGEVYTGKYKSPDGKLIKVAIKRVRFSIKEGPVVIKIMIKELYLWPKLEHSNILPLLGFIVEKNGYPSLISEWMHNGTVLEYARKHQECDVIMHLTLGIAKGLAYLHGKGMVHSDIKSDNILVSSIGDARICDFGITRAMNVSQVALQGNTTAGTTPRWTAFEMLNDPTKFKRHSNESDVWAFGMTLYELLAKDFPFAQHKYDFQVISCLMRKELPTRPKFLDYWPKEKLEGIWKICESCWNFDPIERIKINDVVEELKALGRADS